MEVGAMEKGGGEKLAEVWNGEVARTSGAGSLRENITESLLTKDKLHLGARKGLSDAPVRAEAEAQGVVGVRGAVHVEDVRIREDFFIAVAGSIGSDDALSCFDDLHNLSLDLV